MRTRRALIAKAMQARMEARASFLIRLSLVLIAFVLNGDFHPDLTPGGEGSNFQQYLGLLFWLVIIGSTFFMTPRYEIEWSAGVYATLAFFGLSMASALWADNIQESILKSAAQLIVLIGAWRLAMALPREEITGCMQIGLFAICLLSAGTAIFSPSIGVVSDYLHGGQWSGLFSSKQTLGICAAMLLFFSAFGLMHGADLLYGWISIALSILCLLASGSRGGGAVAVAAIGALYLLRKWRYFTRTLAFMPFVLGITGGGVIAYFLHTQNRYLVVFGAPLDFTERTFIWQHALRFFGDFPWFGSGVNGFWTRSIVKELFLERYHWFLDNYHSGYIAILMETGVVGYFLFLLAYVFFAIRVGDLVRSSILPKSETSFAVSYSCLLFVIDFTETYFLRSTNILATLSIMVMAYVFSRPATASRASLSDASRCVDTQRRWRSLRAIGWKPLWETN